MTSTNQNIVPDSSPTPWNLRLRPRTRMGQSTRPEHQSQQQRPVTTQPMQPEPTQAFPHQTSVRPSLSPKQERRLTTPLRDILGPATRRRQDEIFRTEQRPLIHPQPILPIPPPILNRPLFDPQTMSPFSLPPTRV